MNTDDLLCVGAVDNILVSSTIGRNKMLIPGEVISAIINGTDDLLHEMREMGIGIYPTGGETADVGDLVRTIIVDSTVTCRMKRSDVINNANIRPGDVIVGLSSTGRATYEKKYNGGMGSNGLTSARHDVFAKYLAENYPESYDHAVPDELVYSGKYKLTDEVEGSPINAGELVLSPTRTYAPVIKKILDELRPEVHGMVHCTGGAQTKVLHFVGENCKVVKDNMFPVPPLFKAIHDCSETDWKEMYRYSTWVTAWRSTYVPRLPRRLSPSARASTSMPRLWVTSKKASAARPSRANSEHSNTKNRIKING